MCVSVTFVYNFAYLFRKTSISTNRFSPNHFFNAKSWFQDLQQNINLVVVNRKLFNLVITSSFINTWYPDVEIYTSYTTSQLNLKPLVGVRPIRAEFGPVINDVTSFHYPIDVEKCRATVGVGISLFIAVVTAPGNFERRNYIRQSWLKHMNDSRYHQNLFDLIGFGFVLGQTVDNSTRYRIEEEAKVHKDILQVEMMDGYYNLSMKAAALFNWIYSNCSMIDFVLKIDDDVYINTKNLATKLTRISKTANSMYGLYAGNLFPERGSLAVHILK